MTTTATQKNRKTISPAQLQSEINQLKKDLQDCLEVKHSLEKSHRLYDVLGHIIVGVFQTAQVFHSSQKGSNTGSYTSEPKRYLWSRLRNAIFSAVHLDEYWIRPDFRYSVVLIGEICKELDSQWSRSIGKDFKETDYVNAEDLVYLFLSDKPELAIAAIACLIEAIKTLYDKKVQPKINFTMEELDDLVVSLTTIAFCQRIYAQAKP